MALLILALLQRIFLMSSLMLLLVWLIFFMVLIKLLPILGTISGKTVKLMVLALICLGNNRQDGHPPNCMFSCLQILEAFLWFVLIALLNVTLISLTVSVARRLNRPWRPVSFFHAEDGIRDLTVTGVKTCALPISKQCRRSDVPVVHAPVPLLEALDRVAGYDLVLLLWEDEQSRTIGQALAATTPSRRIARSEERRVGKECRSRWSPYH